MDITKPDPFLPHPTSRELATIHATLGLAHGKLDQDVRELLEYARTVKGAPLLADPCDEDFVMRYLVLCANNMTLAKTAIQYYFKARCDMEEFFGDNDPIKSNIQRSFDVLYAFPLPKLTENCNRVMFFRHITGDVAKYSVKDFLVRAIMTTEVRMREDLSLGDIFIIDLINVQAGHLYKYQLSVLRRFIDCLQNCFPTNILAIHFLNAPYFMDKILALLKPLLGEKQIIIHEANSSTIFDYVSKKLLPLEYNGEAPSMDELNEGWRNKLTSYRSWFLGAGAVGAAAADKRRLQRRLSESADGVSTPRRGFFKQMSLDSLVPNILK